MQDDAIGCKALLLGILERAILDYAGKHESKEWLGRQYKRKAASWINWWHEGDFKEPFTFPWICRELDLNPYEIRRSITSLIKTKGHIRHSARRARSIGLTLFGNCPTATEAEVYFL